MAEITIPRESPLAIPKIVKAHWRSKEPLHLLGEPSTVKSAFIRQTAEQIAKSENDGRKFVDWSRIQIAEKMEVLASPEKYFVYEDLRAAETDIGELRLQDMKRDQEFISYKYNLLFKAISSNSAKGIVFFDEMNLASNMIKAQFYKVYHDRSIGDMPISDNVLVISAGNESSQVRDVTQDSVALTTRRANYFIRPLQLKEFLPWAINEGFDARVIGYLSFQPEDLQTLKFDLADPVGQACARTWHKLSKVMTSNPDLELDELGIISRGYLGPGIATKFVSYVKMAKKIKLSDVIAKPSIVKDITETSMIYAVISGLISKYKQENKELFGVICQVSSNLPEEFGAWTLRLVRKFSGEQEFRKLALEGRHAKHFEACHKRFGDLLND